MSFAQRLQAVVRRSRSGAAAWFVLAAPVATAPACAVGHGDDDPAPCSDQGRFWQASYAELSGTCGAYEGHDVSFSYGLTQSIRIYGDRRVVDETVIRGCSVRLTQVVERDGGVIEWVDGDDLRFDGSDAISGEVVLQRFTDDGQVTCTGEYDLTLTPGDTAP